MLVAAAAKAGACRRPRSRSTKGVLTPRRPASARPSASWPTRRPATSCRCRPTPPLKDPSEFTLIGKADAAPRVDSSPKSNGTRGLHARRPAAGHADRGDGASAALRRQGRDLRCRRRPRRQGRDRRGRRSRAGVAVVATDTWAALQGRDALKVEWDESGAEKRGSTEQLLARVPGSARRSRTRGGPQATATAAALAGGRQDDRGGVRVPLPGARGDGADELRRLAARRPARDLGRPPDSRPRPGGRGARSPACRWSKVKLHMMMSGGSFGRRANARCRLHRRGGQRRQGDRLAARRCKVQWTREDDMRRGLLPADVRARGQGRRSTRRASIVGLAAHASSASRSWPARRSRRSMVKDGIDPTSVEGASDPALRDPESARSSCITTDARRAGAVVALGRHHPHRLCRWRR